MIFLRGARDVGSLCSFEGPPEGWSPPLSVVIARGLHLFPFRTEQLSLSAPMELGSQGPGRVGRRRFFRAENVMPAPPILGGAAHVCSLVARPSRHGAHAQLCARCHRARASAQPAAQRAAVGMRASQRPLGPGLGSALVAQQREVEDAVDEPADGPRVRVASGGGEEHVFAG